jgi:hypothetical protein
VVNGTTIRVAQTLINDAINVAGTATINAPLEVTTAGRISIPTSFDALILTGPTSFASADYNIGDGQIQFGNDFEVADGAILRAELINVVGTFMPGNSTGSVTARSYEQGASATMVMELAGETPGSEHDQLTTLDFVVLGGTIDLDLIDGYKPRPYVEHTLVKSNALMFGQFRLVEGVIQPGVAIGQGLAVTYDYIADEVLVQAALLGDANLDRLVDIGDLGILAANFNTSGATWANGDYNGDGLVDIGDLGILATNFNTALPPAATTVPDPASLALMTLAGLMLIRRRKSTTA